MNWPDAALDNVQRLRVLAAGVAGATVTERVISAPLEDVWPLVADFEGTFGDIEPDMQGVTVSKVDGEHVELLARSRFGFRARLQAVHRPGWFWAQSRFLLVAVAAASEPGGGTRVATTGGVRVPGRAALVPVGVQRAGRRSLERLAGMVG